MHRLQQTPTGTHTQTNIENISAPLTKSQNKNVGFITIFIFIFSRICSGYVLRGFIDDRILPLSDKEVSLTTVQLLSDSSNGELPFQETYLRDTEGNFIFLMFLPENILLFLTRAYSRLVVLSWRLQFLLSKLLSIESLMAMTTSRMWDLPLNILLLSILFSDHSLLPKENHSAFLISLRVQWILWWLPHLPWFCFPKLMEGIGMCEHCHKLSWIELFIN